MTIRQWTGHGDYCLLIEHRRGAWDVTLSFAPHDPDNRTRGAGATFDEAWDNMNPMYA